MNEVLKYFEDNTYYSVVSGNVTFDIQNHDYWEFQKLLVNQCDELEEKDEELEEKDYEIYRLRDERDKNLDNVMFLSKVNDEKQEVIDKAIEFIDKYCIDDEFYINLTYKEKAIIEVKKILQGDDK